MNPGPFVICSKSTWDPPIRREHQLATSAAEDGWDVTFLERPRDVRSVAQREDRRAWLGTLTRSSVTDRVESAPGGVVVRRRSTVVPGHRAALAHRLDVALLSRQLQHLPSLGSAVVVATVPWQWPAVSASSPGRTVFDCADDWTALLPHREAMIRRMFQMAAYQADRIVVASEDLRHLFQGREVALVPNGAGSELLSPPPQPAPGERRLIYAGTLSERFDTEFVREFMRMLSPGWVLDIYGQCQYARTGQRPGAELTRLLNDVPAVRWRGAVDRPQLAKVLDTADVLIIPHRRELPGAESSGPAWRGDSMKLYDYAARGRPIVTTRWGDGLERSGPPVMAVADRPEEFARMVEVYAEPNEVPFEEQRQWALDRSWQARWEQWRAAAL